MHYAVIRTGGKQYRVAPGDVIRIEKLPGDVGSTIEFGEVLLTAADGEVRVGQPVVAGALVRGEIVAHGKAKKILVFKKKRRKNYRRRQGHRQHLTSVRVTAIEAGARWGDHGA
jgi:large subunit ribosomal protein L21